MPQRQVVIGIDMGTTNSLAARVDASGHVVCLPNRDGEALTPSVVAMEESGGVLVGQSARAAVTRTPARTVEAFKRQMGRQGWTWTVDGKAWTAPMLSALVLRRLVEDAERIVGPVGGAVVTVPAYFGDRERTATLEAAAIAGLREVELINEPTAAALASAFEAYLAAGGDGADPTKAAIAATAPAINVICDLGGGTFDVTVIRVSGHDFDILATGGVQLGGRDFDERIVERMVRHLFDCGAADPHHDPLARAKMRLAAEQGKHVLTVKPSAEIVPPYERVVPLLLSREEFESLCVPLIVRARDVIVGVMGEAALEWGRVEDVLLVGGASRMPMFRRMVGELSGRTPNTRLQPDTIVAQGAAVFAAIRSVQDEPTAKVVRPMTLAEVAAPAGPAAGAGDEALVEALPWLWDAGFAAAAGSVAVRDVASQSLGAVVRNPRDGSRRNAVLIRRNAPLPVTASRIFATRHAGQRRVCVPIVEGQSRDPARCVEVGRCVINPLPPGLPRGSRVKVTFSYDREGRVGVRAEELSTGASAETVLHRQAAEESERLTELAEAVAQMSLG